MDHCIFCKILRKEMPSHVLYEDEKVIVILDAFPASKGHCLVVSKEHAENLLELSDETLSRVLPVAKKVIKALKEELNPEGFNVLQNNGKAAGQTVFHYHLQIIPRYSNDDISIKWYQGTADSEEHTHFAEKISRMIC